MTYRTPHGERRTYLTGCRCGDCTRANSRYCKQTRLRHLRGQQVRVSATIARARMDELNGFGFSDCAIAAAAGLSSATVSRIRTEQKVNVHAGTLAALNAVTETATGLVPGDLTRLRVRSLMRAGWDLRSIEAHSGVASLAGGRWRYSDKVSAWVAARIRDTYAALESADGGRRQTAGRARAKGYPLPAQWDDPGTLAWPAGVEPWQPAARPQRGPGRPDLWDDMRWGDVDHLRSYGVPDDQIAERFGITLDGLQRAEHRYGRTAGTPAA